MKKESAKFKPTTKPKTVLPEVPDYQCTSCGRDATLAYVPNTIKSGKNKGKQTDGWDGKVKAGERLCLVCGKKRGINFF